MNLINVYERPLHVEILYEILKARMEEPNTNISHTKMPTIEGHTRFVENYPYAGWYFIDVEDNLAGVVYITHQDEVGIYIVPNQRRKGYAKQALKMLMEKHPAEQYLAHINPKNQQSIDLFNKLGFNLLQQTYALRRES